MARKSDTAGMHLQEFGAGVTVIDFGLGPFSLLKLSIILFYCHYIIVFVLQFCVVFLLPPQFIQMPLVGATGGTPATR